MEEHSHLDEKERADSEEFSNSYYSAGLSALVRSLKMGFFLLSVIVVVMLIWFFTFGGYFTVQPQESVLVFRFGKLIAQYNDSWHWVFPYPVDSIVRVPVKKQAMTVSRFMPDRESAAFPMPGAPEGQGGPLVPGKDGYLLTADANIVHSEWEIFYQISNPTRYYQRCIPSVPERDAKILLKSILENTIIKLTAATKVENTLYKEVDRNYTSYIAAAYAKSIADLDIGISIDRVLLKSKFPPAKTMKAFNEVIITEQQSDSLKQQAETYSIETAQSAQSEASIMVADAESYKKRIVSEVKSESVYFEKLLAEYQSNPDAVLVSLYSTALSDIISSVKDKFVISRNPEGKQQLRLKLNPEPDRSSSSSAASAAQSQDKKEPENKGDMQQ